MILGRPYTDRRLRPMGGRYGGITFFDDIPDTEPNSQDGDGRTTSPDTDQSWTAGIGGEPDLRGGEG